MDSAGDVVEFPIRNVSRGDSGSYSCQYSTKWDPPVWSEPSDPVELVVTEGSYPKPSIAVSPGGVIPVGGNVTIQCRHQRLGLRFLLYKAGDGNYLNYTDPAGSEAEFPITSTRREHGGSYTCRYSNRTVRAPYSEPSDPVQIIVAGEQPSPAPRLPALHPARSPGALTDGPLRALSPAEGTPGREAGTVTEGVPANPSLPRPSISLRLTGVTAPGADAIIRCQGQRRDMRFFLHKAGDLNPQRQMDPAGDGAEFHIPTVGRQHGGSYSCSYRLQSEPFVSSQPSDPVQLAVAEPSYPKPNISLHPSGQVALGGAVTIRCECRCAGARFLLSKAGDPDARRSMDPAGNVAEFPIRNVNRGDAGSYSCQYSTKSVLSVWSEPSDPEELVVTADTRFHPTEETDPAGTQQTDPPPTELEGEGGTNLIHPGMVPTPSHPGGSEPLSPLDLTHTIVTGMSVAAAGLLLLLVAFVCYRRTGGRKGPAPRQSRESEAVKALPSQPQETDSGAEELTYTELGHQAKPGGSAIAPEPVLYATINVIWTLLHGDFLSRAAGERDPDAIAPPLAEHQTREEIGSDFNSRCGDASSSQLRRLLYPQDSH
ncbi:immunoglobulin superfamily member 1-like [Emys orbicularis]|uniref:immunoglobulin superfamily member 1-like n=1 Tax=Emys orbicularis TaxID=82168 RepID=UPI0031FDD58B